MSINEPAPPEAPLPEAPTPTQPSVEPTAPDPEPPAPHPSEPEPFVDTRGVDPDITPEPPDEASSQT